MSVKSRLSKIEMRIKAHSAGKAKITFKSGEVKQMPLADCIEFVRDGLIMDICCENNPADGKLCELIKDLI